MTINFDDEVGAEFDFDCENVASLVVNRTLMNEHFPYEAEISLSLVDEASIKKLNSDYRNMDKATDVLSFPMIDYDEYDSSDRYSFIGKDIGLFNPDNNEVMLGDIVICVPKVYAQAEEYNHSVLREYAFLIAHSMLHLLGYDHMDDNERAVMEDKQNQVLEDINITRRSSDE